MYFWYYIISSKVCLFVKDERFLMILNTDRDVIYIRIVKHESLKVFVLRMCA
jgi:hypothetical protein